MALLNLPFRMRLALVMFLTMACTSAILIVSYIQQNRDIKSYVADRDSRLLAISEIAQTKIETTATREQALDVYKRALEAEGLSYVVASPSGEVVAGTDPLKKKINIKKPRRRGKRLSRNASHQWRKHERCQVTPVLYAVTCAKRVLPRRIV